MNTFPQVLPECYADTVLVEVLGFTKPNHQLSIGKVLSQMESAHANKAMVGIVDDDKRKPGYFQKFTQTEECEGIKRYQKDSQVILVISPAFETWVFENAAAAGVDPGKYGFSDRKSFEKACKKQDAGKNTSLKNFLNTLKQKQAPGFKQLRDWICEAARISPDDLL